jgi:hypothetical protein
MLLIECQPRLVWLGEFDCAGRRDPTKTAIGSLPLTGSSIGAMSMTRIERLGLEEP